MNMHKLQNLQVVLSNSILDKNYNKSGKLSTSSITITRRINVTVLFGHVLHNIPLLSYLR